MAFYRECPYCGCALVPEEKCDCQEVKEQKIRTIESLFETDRKGQLYLNFDIGGKKREKVAL